LSEFPVDRALRWRLGTLRTFRGREFLTILFKPREEISMAQYGSGGNGTIRQLYGVIIRDKIKSASLETLQAYRIVANDLLKSNEGDDGELRASLADLEKAIAAKK
jgi:hypothetical protein